MDVLEAFPDFQVEAEVNHTSLLVLNFFTSTNSSFEVVNIILVLLSESGGIKLEIGAFRTLGISAVEVEFHVVCLMFINSDISLFSKSLEGLAYTFHSLRTTEFSSKDLAHGSRASFATREPPELEFLRADLAVKVEVEISHHVAKFGHVQVNSEGCSDQLEFSFVDKPIFIFVEFSKHLVDVSLNFLNASLYVLSSSSVIFSTKDLGVLELSR